MLSCIFSFAAAPDASSVSAVPGEIGLGDCEHFCQYDFIVLTEIPRRSAMAEKVLPSARIRVTVSFCSIVKLLTS